MKKTWLAMLLALVVCSSIALAQPAPADGKALPQAGDAVKTPAAKPAQLRHKHTPDCMNTTAEPVQIICVLDRSGSMRNLAGDTIGGYNSFLEQQRQKEGEAQVTTVLFDDKYELVTDGVDLREAPDLNSDVYFARGMTALLDAVGRTVTNTLNRMEEEGVCPANRRVLVLIMTDGLENNSREYSKAAVKGLIDATTKEYGWNYIFMGANIDSVSEAASLGIKADYAVDYSHDSAGVAKSFDRMVLAADEVRENGRVSKDWKAGK